MAFKAPRDHGSFVGRWPARLATATAAALALGVAGLVGLPASAEELRLPGIKGADDRAIIDSTAYPWSAIGRVNRSTGGFCTGVAIAPRQVLTAAHCLWNKRTGRWLPADSLHFVVGYRRGEFLAHARVAALRPAPTFGTPPADNADPASDWAVLTLASDLDGAATPLPIAPIAEADLARYRKLGARFVQAGYSQDKAHILTAHDSCAVLGLGGDALMFFHDCDATRGDSGSPILLRLGDAFSVIGIHVGNATFAGRVVGVSAAAQQALAR